MGSTLVPVPVFVLHVPAVPFVLVPRFKGQGQKGQQGHEGQRQGLCLGQKHILC